MAQLESHGMEICEMEVSSCLERMGFDPTPLFGAFASSFNAMDSLCVAQFMDSWASPSSPCPGDDEEVRSATPKLAQGAISNSTSSNSAAMMHGPRLCVRSLSPTGVDEIGLLDGPLSMSPIKPFSIRRSSSSVGAGATTSMDYFSKTSSGGGPLFNSLQGSAFSGFAAFSSP